MAIRNDRRVQTALRLALAAALVSTVTVTAQPRKILRYQDAAGEKAYGLLDGEDVRELRGGLGDFMRGSFEFSGKAARLSAVRLLPPVEPPKIIAFGWTYSAHAQEVGGEVNRKEPLVFLKPPTAVIGPGDTIRLPHGLSARVECEGELAIIIGRTAKNVTPEEASGCILGYTCFNDVTARDLTEKDPEFTRGKGFDTFAPLGPWIVTGLRADDLKLTTRINGHRKQDARTSAMVYDIPFLISYISKVMTLQPGDIIATGTPGGSTQMTPGDVVEVEIEGIGSLVNHVR
jgi:2-keto-4-pentenoate hydratase/2-oxohepta-3-ene-1,7-dioic acid hydratase in catechol pathway